jgi:hypothetical protein
MKINLILILVIYLCALPSYMGSIYAQSPDTGIVEGRVLNYENGDPLPDVHIFLSGTTVGTITNSNGWFRMRNVSPGSYKLTISIIGFERTSEDVLIKAGETKSVLVETQPKVYEMNEIYVGNLDDRWERYLQRFYNLFIGQSQRADSVKILNPEVLRFDSRWWGRFTAEALAPLIIENRSLGYQITYYLDDFYHSGSITRWDGDPLFTELAPKDSLQAALWEKNRKEAFYGSLRHFLISIHEKSVPDNGFIVHLLPRDIRGISRQNRFRANTERFLREADEEPLKRFNFSGRLEIVYTGQEEDPRYVQWARDLRRGPARSQTSYLELNKRPITIDPDGEISETYGATRYGYFAFQRLADKTPREYRPDNW